jgi:transcription antitermination factor NusG
MRMLLKRSWAGVFRGVHHFVRQESIPLNGELSSPHSYFSSQMPNSLTTASDTAKSAVGGLNWCALYTAARHEKRVAQHLESRGIEYFLPLYRTRRRWSDGSKVVLDLPLFPGYLFVRMHRNERVRVLEVPGALSVVAGTGKEAAVLADSEVDALRTGLAERRAQPHPLLVAGQRGRIRSGPLAGMQGVIVRTKSNLRVVLTLELIMQSMAVEVGLEEIEPLAA